MINTKKFLLLFIFSFIFYKLVVLESTNCIKKNTKIYKKNSLMNKKNNLENKKNNLMNKKNSLMNKKNSLENKKDNLENKKNNLENKKNDNNLLNKNINSFLAGNVKYNFIKLNNLDFDTINTKGGVPEGTSPVIQSYFSSI